MKINGLDKGIEKEVMVLIEGGIEAFESCQGGEGHPCPDPFVRFHGQKGEGFKALSVALKSGLKPSKIGRVWDIIDGEPTGPYWEMEF